MNLGLLGGLNQDTDKKIDRLLRPKTLDEYIGQEPLKNKLRIAIECAKLENREVPSIIISSRPGLGKSTIAEVIANEANVPIKTVFAPSLKSVSDIIEIVSKLQEKSILFLDEMHHLSPKIAECMYPCMDEFKFHIKLQNKQILPISTPRFCLMGATTSIGTIPAPMRDRFSIQHSLDFYTDDELAKIIEVNAKRLNVQVSDQGVYKYIATKARGTPRYANRILYRIYDYVTVKAKGALNISSVKEALDIEGIDESGLTSIDRKYLFTMFKVFSCGPAGIRAISTSMNEDQESVMNFVEPFLLRCSFILLTPRGRALTAEGTQIALEILKNGQS